MRVSSLVQLLHRELRSFLTLCSVTCWNVTLAWSYSIQRHAACRPLSQYTKTSTSPLTHWAFIPTVLLPFPLWPLTYTTAYAAQRKRLMVAVEFGELPPCVLYIKQCALVLDGGGHCQCTIPSLVTRSILEEGTVGLRSGSARNRLTSAIQSLVDIRLTSFIA